MLKGVRNNLITKDLKYEQDGKTKHAKWEHLKMLLKIKYVGDAEISLNKLTRNHMNKEKKNGDPACSTSLSKEYNQQWDS